MKNIIMLTLLITSLSSYAQFYTELGSGYAFSTKKSTTTFSNYNNNFMKIGNIFTGIFYYGNIGYTFKNNLAVELNCKFNPKPIDILNFPKSIVVNYDHLRFFDGSYFSIVPRIIYQYKVRNFYLSAGWGIGYNLLNYYSYNHTGYYYRRSINEEIIYYDFEYKEYLYRYSEEQYRMNLNFKMNYTISKNVDIFFEANTNLKFYLSHSVNSKFIYNKFHTETYDIDNNPVLTITDINEKNVNGGRYISFAYLDRSVYDASDLSKLIYTQIGLRYTFSKNEKKK